MVRYNREKIFMLTVCFIVSFLLSESAFCVSNKENLMDYHATIEIIDFNAKQGKVLTIKEEWFKKPNMIRREMFTVGVSLTKKILIYDGNYSYSYFPSSNDFIAYKEDFDWIPSFHSYIIPKDKAKLLDKYQLEIEDAEVERFNGKEAYMKLSRVGQDNKITQLKTWIDKENYNVLGWEKEVYNIEGKMIRQELCKNIDYDVDVPDAIFKLPEKYKIHQQDISFNTTIIPESKKNTLTKERMQDILSQEELTRDLLKRYPDVYGVYSHLANIILFKGQYEEAIALLNKSLELNPDQEDLYMTLSEVYLAKGDFDKAIEAAERALEFSPKDPYSYYFLGIICEKANIFDKATASYKQALDLQEDDIIRNGKQEYSIEGLRKEYIDAYNRVKNK